jgi:hypothetical protein
MFYHAERERLALGDTGGKASDEEWDLNYFNKQASVGEFLSAC